MTLCMSLSLELLQLARELSAWDMILPHQMSLVSRDEVNNASRRSSSVLSYIQEDEAAVIISFPYSFPSVFESEEGGLYMSIKIGP